MRSALDIPGTLQIFVFSVFVSAALIAPCSAGGEKLRYIFQGGSDGAGPSGQLISDSNGTLYGTTSLGGGGTECSREVDGCGTIFKLMPDGTERLLYAFQGGSDGAYPRGSLLVDGSGNYFGTTPEGGGSGCSARCGAVFELSSGGAETVLYAFLGGSDGGAPNGDLITDSEENLYGTTASGGSFNGSLCSTDGGCGTVFRVAPDGTETALYAFQAGNDGAFPYAGVLMDSSENLYGTTTEGGASCTGNTYGCGTVFKVTPSGSETVLYSFRGGDDGNSPRATLISDQSGNFYGTTAGGGGNCNCGTVFKLAPDGTEAVLYAFQGGTDGLFPFGGLVMDKAGNLYGTTYSGGHDQTCDNTEKGCGTVFKISTNGGETVLYRFKWRSNGAAPSGAFPNASLLLGKHGALYGTASAGGRDNDGVVFSVTTK